MKTSLYLFSLLIFLSACDTFNQAKTTNAEKSSVERTRVPVDASAIPVEYAYVDTIPIVDSLAVIEPEEPKNPLEYMTIEEKGMIDEINLLRADPNAYARFIDDYIQTFVEDSSKDAEAKRKEMAAASALITELQMLEPLPALLPHYKLYKVAKLHGEDLVEMKKIDPIGSDGSHPFQRIHDGAELNGVENLFLGYATMRESIISLLVDGQKTNRVQRSNILDPQWEFVSCHEVGTVGDNKNVWIQLFGFSIEEDLDIEEEADLDEEIDMEEDLLNNSTIEKEVIVATPAIVLENKKSEPVWDFSFMISEEKVMIDEINLLRSNPAGYIQYVELYSKKYEKQYPAEDKDFTEAVKELKEQLENMKPLSQLQPNEQLYNVAKAHGLDNNTHNRLEHIGTDKSDPFDRVKRSGLKNYIDSKGYFAPNENLVGGENSPRESVVALLIDAGVSSRGHRKALLEPNWEYVACYKIGLIENLKELKGQEMDDMNNCWVQLFAMD